jgi:hypothetical protein
VCQPTTLSRGNVTLSYNSLTLTDSFQSTHFNDIWDLTGCDLDITYKVDLSHLTQSAPTESIFLQIGIREQGDLDFNPGNPSPAPGGKGGWMLSTIGDLGPGGVEPVADLDDHHLLQSAADVYELGYDATAANTIVAPFGTYQSHGLWFDRDAVSPDQAMQVTSIDGGTYNTGGVYRIAIRVHALEPRLGTMFATVNNVPQGFFRTVWANTLPDIYPAGLSLSGDVTRMQVFVGLNRQAGVSGDVLVSELRVAGCK